MKIGDVVVLKTGAGREFLGRVLDCDPIRAEPTWSIADARWVIWRRVAGEFSPARADDPRLAEFLRRSPGPALVEPAPAAAPKPAAETPWRPLADRICEALAEGLETAPEIARKLDAQPESVHERLKWLEAKGRAMRVDPLPRHVRGNTPHRWKLTRGAA